MADDFHYSGFVSGGRLILIPKAASVSAHFCRVLAFYNAESDYSNL